MGTSLLDAAMAFSVNGKTALVTGGGSGICLAFTKLLLSRHCNVVIADLRLTAEAEELVAAEKAGEGLARIVFKKTDVTNWKQLQSAFDTAISEFRELDIVCPGAGIFDPVSQPSIAFAKGFEADRSLVID